MHRCCGHNVHELHGRLLLELDQCCFVHCLPDGHGLPGLHDDGQEHLRLRRGLRVERRRVRRLHGWHLVRRRLYYLLGLYVVHGGQLRVDRVLGDGRHRVLCVHGWRELVCCGRYFVSSMHHVPDRREEDSHVHFDGRHCLCELRCWAVLDYHQRGDLYSVSHDGGSLRLAWPQWAVHVRLQLGKWLRLEYCKRSLRIALCERLDLELGGTRTLRGLHVLRGLGDACELHGGERCDLRRCLRGGPVLNRRRRPVPRVSHDAGVQH